MCWDVKDASSSTRPVDIGMVGHHIGVLVCVDVYNKSICTKTWSLIIKFQTWSNDAKGARIYAFDCSVAAKSEAFGGSNAPVIEKQDVDNDSRLT